MEIILHFEAPVSNLKTLVDYDECKLLELVVMNLKTFGCEALLVLQLFLITKCITWKEADTAPYRILQYSSWV